MLSSTRPLLSTASSSAVSPVKRRGGDHLLRPSLPLQLGLLPQLEISLILVEEHFAVKRVSIVGYFHANERFDDQELGSLAKNVGGNIYRYLPQAAVLLFDSKKLAALSKTKDRSTVVQILNDMRGLLQAELQ